MRPPARAPAAARLSVFQTLGVPAAALWTQTAIEPESRNLNAKKESSPAEGNLNHYAAGAAVG